MLAFIIYFLIGFGIGLIVRKNIEVVSSKRKYVTLIIVATATLAIYTGNVSPRAAGAIAAFTLFGCLSALTAKYDFIKKLKSKYVHYWLIPVMLICWELVVGFFSKNEIMRVEDEETSINESTSDNKLSDLYVVDTIVPLQFSSARDFSKIGLAAVEIGGVHKYGNEINGKWGFIDKKGVLVINPIYDEVRDFSENGYAWVKSSSIGNGKFGLINIKGNYIINPQFDNVYNFTSKNYAGVKVNDKWGLINISGEFVIKPIYDGIFGFWSLGNSYIPKNGLIPVRVKNNDSHMWGFVDIFGGSVISPVFNDVEKFSDNGLAAVMSGARWDSKEATWIGGKWGFIDRNGNYVIPPQFDGALWFDNYADSLAPVKIGGADTGKWGFINTGGNFKINPIFDNVGTFSNLGLADVNFNDVVNNNVDELSPEDSFCYNFGRSGYIRKNGKYAIEPHYEYTDLGPFLKGQFAVPVCSNGKYGAIDINGEFVIQPEYQFVGESIQNIMRVAIDDKWGYVTVSLKDSK